MARNVGSKRRNKRGTAPGISGKHRATGFMTQADIDRRRQGSARTFTGFFVLIVIIIALAFIKNF